MRFPVRSLALPLSWLTTVACDPPPSDTQAPDEAPRVEERSGAEPTASPEPTPPVARPRTITAKALRAQLLGVRRVADVVEIEMQLDEPLAPSSRARPTLTLGSVVVRRSRSGSEGRLDRLVFTLPASQYEALSPDTEVVLSVGLRSNAASESRPRLGDLPIRETK